MKADLEVWNGQGRWGTGSGREGDPYGKGSDRPTGTREETEDLPSVPVGDYRDRTV